MGKTDQSDLFETDKIKEISIIETMEDMDLYSAIQIKEHFNNLCNAGKKRFIIDLKNTRYLDSSGLGVLIHIHTSAVKDKSIIVRFINIVETVFKVLKLTHLDNMFWIASDMDTAIKEIKIQQSGKPAKQTTGKTETETETENEDEFTPQINESRLNDEDETLPDEEEYVDEEDKDFVTEEEEEEDALFMDVENYIEEDDDLDTVEYVSDKEKKKILSAAQAHSTEQKETKIDIKQIVVNGDSSLFHRSDLKFKSFHITVGQIQKAIIFLMQDHHYDPDDLEHLEHQLYELLKNAVKHGNKNKWWKPVKVWYKLKLKEAHFIIEDKGKGFRQIEQWNELFRQRAICYHNKDRESLKKYRSFRTEESDKSDRGTALFSAIEYWNCGIVFNDKRNSVAVKVVFNK